MSILDLYCSVDEFWQQFAPWWEQQLVVSGARRRRPTRLHPNEIMTIAILFQQSGYRTFKAFYTEYVQQHLRGEFGAPAQLQLLRRGVAAGAGAADRLHAHAPRSMQWHQLHRLDGAGRLPQRAHSPAPLSFRWMPAVARPRSAGSTASTGSPPITQALIEPLSKRELQVLRLLGTELDGPDMARELVVSLNTVRTHIKNIYSKLGVSNRQAAIRRAEELDLL